MNIAELMERQRSFYNSGATKDVDFRLAQLKKLKQMVESKEKEIMNALFMDLGKSSFESYETEIGIFYQEIDHTIKNLRKWAKPKRVKTPFAHFPSKSMVYSDPYGLVLIISPWNYPFQLTLHPLIAAIAAGNTVVIKPSEISQYSTNILIEIVEYCCGKDRL